MNSEDKIMQAENPQLVGREQIAVYVPVNDILNGMAEDPGERFKGDPGNPGDPGQDGVGIASISVGANNNLVIQLTDGNTYDIDLPFVEGSPGSSGGGTKITVGGVEVSEWNADNKVDKNTSTNTDDRAYVVTADGTNTLYPISKSATGNSIARRNADGTLEVAYPSQPSHAATLRYVEDAISAISSGGGSTTIDISGSATDGEGKGDLCWSSGSEVAILLNTLMSSEKLVHLTLINDNEESMVIPLPPLGDTTSYSLITISAIDPKGVIIQLDWYGDYKGFELFYRGGDSTSWFYEFSQLAIDGYDRMYLTY